MFRSFEILGSWKQINVGNVMHYRISQQLSCCGFSVCMEYFLSDTFFVGCLLLESSPSRSSWAVLQMEANSSMFLF